MQIAFVGKPSVGKSTLFKACTLAQVEIHERPFTTLKTNSGVGYVKVKDIALEISGKHSNPREGYVLKDYRFVPVNLLDVPGLIEGSYKGAGMGNEFLSDLNQADALIHVIDVSGSTNEKGESVKPGSHNPSEDVRFLDFELDMWFLQILKKGWEKFSRTVKYEGSNIVKALAKQLSGLRVTEEMVKDAIKNLDVDCTKWGEKDMMGLAGLLRRKAKPMIIAANKIDVPGAKENFEKLKKEFKDYLIIGCSAESELALKEASKKGLIDYVPGENEFQIKNELNDKQINALEFIKKNSMPTGVQKILDLVVFDVLNYIAIHPGGVSKLEDSEGRVLPDCFLMREGTTALDFAFRLHTDFGKNFIRAIDVKTKKMIGKDHLLKNLDVIELIVKK